MKDDDHDLLIRIDTKLDLLQKQFSNHLKHHFVYTLALFTSLLSVIGAVIFVALT